MVLERRIRGMNAIAKIYRTRNAEVGDLNRALIIDPEFWQETAYQHDESVTSVAIVEAMV
jgi:hypothetical protein